MIEINIPGFDKLYLEHLVLDYNGTLAFDGKLLKGVSSLLKQLADHLHIHVITADTFGSVKNMFADAPCTISVIPIGGEDKAKADYVEKLGAHSTASIGNGRNDRIMLEKSALGIAIIQQEGASLDAVMAADIVSTSILQALDLFLNPDRLIATLRS